MYLVGIHIYCKMIHGPYNIKSILILSSHLHLGLSSGVFPSGFPTKILYTPLVSLISATCPAHLILLYVIPGKILDENFVHDKVLLISECDNYSHCRLGNSLRRPVTWAHKIFISAIYKSSLLTSQGTVRIHFKDLSVNDVDTNNRCFL